MKSSDIQTVVIATHVFAFGTSQGLRDYCNRKGFDVLFIGHPLFGTVWTWFMGSIDTIWQVVCTGKKYDVYVGSNNLNATIGLLLRLVGRVRKVVYFSPDWVVDRFRNPFLNRLYHWLDYICVAYCDITWNSSVVMPIDPMMREREKLGYPRALRKKQIQVSDGTEVIPLPPMARIDRWKIGFIGHLRPGMGVELLLKAMPFVLKKIPKASMLIMGSGPLEKQFRKQAIGLPIEFTGFMADIKEVYTRLSRCAIAVAPYEPGTISEYTDPGKVKSYLTSGLPIVITDVPRVAQDIKSKKAGVVATYAPEPFADAIISMLSDTGKLQVYRKNALRLRDEYSWDKLFDRAISLL